MSDEKDHGIYVQPGEHDVTIANATIFGNDEPPEEPTEPPYDHASYKRYGYGEWNVNWAFFGGIIFCLLVWAFLIYMIFFN